MRTCYLSEMTKFSRTNVKSSFQVTCWVVYWYSSCKTTAQCAICCANEHSSWRRWSTCSDLTVSYTHSIKIKVFVSVVCMSSQVNLPRSQSCCSSSLPLAFHGCTVVYSVTRLGYFLKLLVTNFLTKVAHILGEFWVFYKTPFWTKNQCCYFLGNFLLLWSHWLVA